MGNPARKHSESSVVAVPRSEGRLPVFRRPSSNVMSDVIEDWENRAFSQNIVLAVSKLVDFLNNFEVTTRHRLAIVSQRMTSIERQVAFLETAISKPSQGE